MQGKHDITDDAGIWVVIPAYNEGALIGRTCTLARQHFRNIVVIDDCSGDDTGSLALAAGCHVCRHPINLGQGAALATGFKYAIAQGASIIVTFDADGQHGAADAMAMVGILRTAGCDVVLGSRFLGKADHMPVARRIVVRLAVAFTRLTTGLHVSDTHNGLRAMTAQAAGRIRIRHNRMAHASEILSEIARLGLDYREAPCLITYSPYSLAKGQRLSGAFNILKDLFLGQLHR